MRCGVSAMRSNAGVTAGGGASRLGTPLDAIEAGIKCIGETEIAANHFDVVGTSGGWVARQRADFCARGRQLRDDLASDAAGAADNENRSHEGTCYGRRYEGSKEA
jgi:hypothetical protein